MGEGEVPLSLKLGKRLSLSMITNDLNIDIASQIQLLRTEEWVWGLSSRGTRSSNLCSSRHDGDEGVGVEVKR